MNNCRFKRTNSIRLNNSTVIIDKPIICKETKEVYEVIFNLQDKKRHILKIIYGEDSESINTIDFYMNDSNHYFMEMIDFFKDDNKTFLLLNYYEDKTIYEYVQKHELTDYEKNSFIENILEIGCYLHKNSYLHADIKPDNFFIDKPKVRLGDLESTVKLDDIHNDTIHALCGTQGFKYSSNHTYSIKDEIFAYIATIYFIEVGEVLISKEEFSDLVKEENPFKAINEFAREYIESYIERESIQNFLLDILDLLEDEEEIDCCSMLKQFQLLPKEQKEEEPLPPIETEVEIKKESPPPIKREEPKPQKRWIKPTLITLSLLGSVTIGVSYLSEPNTPHCDQAHFIDNHTIKVSYHNNTLFYDYSKEKIFSPISDHRYMELLDDPREKKKNENGEVIECRDGRVYVY